MIYMKPQKIGIACFPSLEGGRMKKAILFVLLAVAFSFAADSTTQSPSKPNNPASPPIMTQDTFACRERMQFLQDEIDELNRRGLKEKSEEILVSPDRTRYQNLFAAITIAGGIVAGVCVVFDATGSTSVNVPDYGTVNVKHQWTTGHTICFTLSLSAIAAGISLLCH
jgi:hypothetical protein